MSKSTLNVLLKDYEQKKYIADLNFERDKAAFYASHPELSDLNYKLGKLALDISKAVLNGNTELEKELKNKEKFLSTTDIPKRS